MKASVKHILTISYYLSLAYFSYLMVLITIQYIPIEFDVAFLRIKQEEIKLKHYQIAFFTHVYTSIFTLFFGALQFSDFIRKKYVNVHRYLGYSYIILILFFASPSGLIMGYYANGGLFSQISFCVLSILWFLYTYVAFIKAKNKKWNAHKNYMLRSYALTLSAITLRLFKYFIANTFELPPMDIYKIVAWSWIINLLIVELYIFFNPKKIKITKLT